MTVKMRDLFREIALDPARRALDLLMPASSDHDGRNNPGSTHDSRRDSTTRISGATKRKGRATSTRVGDTDLYAAGVLPGVSRELGDDYWNQSHLSFDMTVTERDDWMKNWHRLDDVERTELRDLAIRHGIDEVIRLFLFTHEWKMGDWRGLRSKRDKFPSLELCREVFGKTLRPESTPDLYRGVKVGARTPLGRGEPGDQFPIKLPKRSISSWTTSVEVARRFGGAEYSRVDPDTSCLSLYLWDRGDAVMLACPPDFPGLPSWYRKMSRSFGAKGGGVGEAEIILSISRCTIEIFEQHHIEPARSDVNVYDKLRGKGTGFFDYTDAEWEKERSARSDTRHAKARGQLNMKKRGKPAHVRGANAKI